jgi:hypothetical protein
MFCAPVPQKLLDARHLEPAAVLRHRAARPPVTQHRTATRLLHRPRARRPSFGVLDRALRQGERTPAEPHHSRPGLCHRPDQLDHALTRLGLDRDLPLLGRLGRLLRPRQTSRRRQPGLRNPAAGTRDETYARRHFIDHQILSQDAYLKFIEDDFLHGQRIDPRTDGRPTPAPTCARTSRSSATSPTTSTSTKSHYLRSSSRSARRSAEAQTTQDVPAHWLLEV